MCNIEAISKESCPVWCSAYNSNFLVVVDNITIDMVFPLLAVEHLPRCLAQAVGSLTN